MRYINLIRLPVFITKRSKSSVSTMKVFTQRTNPISGSSEWDVQDENYDYHQEIARSAFADMLHDTERNKKYQKALQLAIEKMHSEGKKAHVLDIGTGTGLLSIMAVRCGADSVVACEAFEPMAECCLKILERNKVADKITLIPKRSTELTVGENGDLKQKANILVTEVFDTELIGEGALSTFSHAHRVLLEEDCIVVPDSAVMYAQVVECSTLWKWNKLNDLADEDLEVVLRTPQKMKDCPGSAAVHDLQLSQIPRYAFRELSDRIPVFTYDWSGRTPTVFNQTLKHEFRVTETGKAQVVFMWWELNMDTEGKILLSCAPWWYHPDADIQSDRPQDTIPWRDHWMQAVYYLPKELTLQKGAQATLISCQDEYSLWFYLENKDHKYENYNRPACDCGVHMALSRTHVSYLNDGKRSKKYLSKLKEVVMSDSIVLDLNGAGLMGLAAAKLGAKIVYIQESSKMNIDILNDYIATNNLQNVHIVSEMTIANLRNVTILACDPNFVTSILPWDNLKMAYLLNEFKLILSWSTIMIPERFELWAMPVEFKDLHKIRVPLVRCEDIDMTIFDSLVESSRKLSDSEYEAQPLWEYPCKSRGPPAKILSLDFRDLEEQNRDCGEHNVKVTEPFDMKNRINGFAIWVEWKIGGMQSSGPVDTPVIGEYVNWDPHTRQAVKIFKRPYNYQSFKWNHRVSCDFKDGYFKIDINILR